MCKEHSGMEKMTVFITQCLCCVKIEAFNLDCFRRACHHQGLTENEHESTVQYNAKKLSNLLNDKFDLTLPSIQIFY